MKLCDAHCHLANLSQIMPLKPLFAEAEARGITHYLSSALSKSDLTLYPQLQQECPGTLLYSAGIHPFFDECDLEFEDIVRACEQQSIWAIGEIGMDRANPDKPGMRDTFTRQLELAESYGLPVVLHIVGHQQEALNTMRKHPLRYLMHGYAGSLEAFNSFLEADCYFTISERILREDKHDLLKAMLKCGRYLFETDITRYYVHEAETNPLLRLFAVLEDTARISGIATTELIDTQAANYQILTGIRL